MRANTSCQRCPNNDISLWLCIGIEAKVTPEEESSAVFHAIPPRKQMMKSEVIVGDSGVDSTALWGCRKGF